MPIGLKKIADPRHKRIVAHRARSHTDADRWDLEFWQKQTPQMRLPALVAILEDIQKVKKRLS